ncbi:MULTISPECIES: metallopeptidase TldD-related protein [unclassified Clostridium]|uniref:metallopeptidase TldD-related protein n=1 Tax=unclassified Clostridium TaxID=2614128 RepID=UPI001897C796|nr:MULTISPECIES: metallopeptidase TldD-related protein [unclassified Clostridium]
MINLIKELLKKHNIEEYIVSETEFEDVELYFIKDSLDMKRSKHLLNYSVKIFNNFDENGEKFKGETTLTIYPSMTKEEIDKAIEEGYYIASLVKNKYYDLPKGNKNEKILIESKLSESTLEENAIKLEKALFKNNNIDKGFINSAEIFVEKVRKKIVGSNGTDIEYTKYSTNGEYVTQWIDKEDVELYNSFSYNDLEEDELSLKVKESIINTGYREKSLNPPKTDFYNVILSGEEVKTLLSYYLENSEASMIYQGYSNFKINSSVQGKDVKGDKINIKLTSSVPFSNEGVKLIDRTLIDNCELKSIYGSSRFMNYLRLEPIGEYDGAIISEGNTPFNDMIKNGDLHIIKFSDFQMDSLTGDFFGEIRLALLKDGDNIIPLTGGSLSANIKDVQGDFILSKEVQNLESYKLPLAIKLNGVEVSGK